MILLVTANARMGDLLCKCSHPYGTRHLLFVSTSTQRPKSHLRQSFENAHNVFAKYGSTVRKLPYTFEIIKQTKCHCWECKVAVMVLERDLGLHRENSIILLFS